MNGKLFCKVNSALLFISIILGFSNYLLSPSSVFAASSAFNKQINYQGKLTNSSSVTVTDGDYNMEFKIYTTSSGGSPIWTETRTGTDKVTITSGLFSVLLGSVTSLASLNYNQDLYLSVNIGGTGAASWDGEMTPRKRFGTVPSAFEADKIDGLDSSQLVRSDDSNTIASSSASTLLGLTQLGGGNVFEASSTAGALFVVRNAGNVGIGTTSPYAAFSVVGSTGVVADNFTATGTQFVSSFQQILANSSSTLQNFTAILSTTTSATTTSLGVSGTASSSALVVSGNASSTTLLGNLSVTGTAGFNRLYLTGATSTFASGLNLSAGCFAVNGTCINNFAVSTIAQSKWATSTDNLTISPAGASSVVVGGSATTTVGKTFEVIGNALFDGIYASSTSMFGAHIDLTSATTSGSLTVTNSFGLNSEYFTDLTGAGLVNTSGTLTLAGLAQSKWATSSASTTAIIPSGGDSISLGIATATPGSRLAVGGIANFSTATSSFYSSGGIDLSDGCFSIDGTCVGGSSLAMSSITQSKWATSSDNVSLQPNAGTGIIVTNSTTTSATTTSFVTTGTASSSALVVSGNATSTTLLGNLSVTGTAGFNRLYLTGATSTFASGLNLSAGCFAVNGTCVGGSSLTGSGAANRAAFWTAAGNLSYDDTFVWDNTNKRLGIGTSTPWGALSIANNPSGNLPILTIATTSIISDYGSLFSVFATTSGPMDYARVAIGTTTLGSGGLRDQLVVAGRIYSTWRYVDCDIPGLGVETIVIADRGSICGDLAFDVDADGAAAPQSTYPPALRLRAGVTSITSGDGAYLRSGSRPMEDIYNPIMEAKVSVPSDPGSVNTLYMVGLWDKNMNSDLNSSTKFVAFQATSTNTWIAVSQSGGTCCDIFANTGIATSSIATLRLELHGTTAVFLANNKVVAQGTTILSANNLGPIVGSNMTAADGNIREIDVHQVRVWLDDPPTLNEQAQNETDVEDELLADMAQGASYGISYKLENRGDLLTGTIVKINIDSASSSPAGIVQSTKEYDDRIVGVVADDLYSIAGTTAGNINIATMGRVRVLVASSSPPIKKGDHVTSSSEAGRAMLADRPGFTLGIALEDYNASSTNLCMDEKCQGRVLIHLNPGFNVNVKGIFKSVGDLVTDVTSVLADLADTTFKDGIDTVKFVVGKIVAKVAVIGDLFTRNIISEKIKTNQLCLGESCVTERELKALFEQGGIILSPQGQLDDNVTDEGTASTTSSHSESELKPELGMKTEPSPGPEQKIESEPQDVSVVEPEVTLSEETTQATSTIDVLIPPEEVIQEPVDTPVISTTTVSEKN